MKSMWKFFYPLLIAIMLLWGCGGGGGSDSNGSGSAGGFTAALLDAAPTFFVHAPDGATGGTRQGTVAFFGTGGTYTIAFLDEDFDGNGSRVFWEASDFVDAVSLQTDGTLKVSTPDGVTIITLLAKTELFLDVTGKVVDGSTWTDRWHFSPPEGWLIPGKFTAALLDAGPIFYVQYPDTATGGTHQETIVVSGTGGSYSISFTDEDFNANGLRVSTETDEAAGTLQADGTLAVVAPDGSGILTLLEKTEAYLDVTGRGDGSLWADPWNFSQPAGWITVPN